MWIYVLALAESWQAIKFGVWIRCVRWLRHTWLRTMRSKWKKNDHSIHPTNHSFIHLSIHPKYTFSSHFYSLPYFCALLIVKKTATLCWRASKMENQQKSETTTPACIDERKSEKVRHGLRTIARISYGGGVPPFFEIWVCYINTRAAANTLYTHWRQWTQLSTDLHSNLTLARTLAQTQTRALTRLCPWFMHRHCADDVLFTLRFIASFASIIKIFVQKKKIFFCINTLLHT